MLWDAGEGTWQHEISAEAAGQEAEKDLLIEIQRLCVECLSKDLQDLFLKSK